METSMRNEFVELWNLHHLVRGSSELTIELSALAEAAYIADLITREEYRQCMSEIR